MTIQDQFLDVIDREEAEARFRGVLRLEPLGEELVPLDEALGRVLSRDVVSQIDVPFFDRSNVDGFAVCAADTFGAQEESPQTLRLLAEVIAAGVEPQTRVEQGTALSIATGGMLPRGADAVVMVEYADAEGGQLLVRKAVTPGTAISFAGSDVAAGETVLRGGVLLTSRETGVLAAIGAAQFPLWRQPRIGIISTGDEIIPPGSPMGPAKVYDSNAQILSDAVRELGGLPRCFGIVQDDFQSLQNMLHKALEESDVVLLSGGTSKGEGDLCYRVVAELNDPGIVVHGVALKPGKPICLAASGGKPVVILPGFPTSAIFTFHEFVAPVVRLLGGRSTAAEAKISARLAVKFQSEVGRTEYLLVGLIDGPDGPTAYPMGKGSGSVTTFSQADGFVTIGRLTELLPAGAQLEVQRIGREQQLTDLVIIGSHCVGLDTLLSRLQAVGVTSKLLTVGSSAGLAAAERGECDLAGIHLLDPASGEYNRPLLSDALELIRGYGRRQGIVFRCGDRRFEGRSVEQIVAVACDDADCLLVGRNQGSGTRVLLDRLLGDARPAGYSLQPRSHNGVAAAVAQGRADWGLAIESVALANDLAFVPYQDEQFDFVVPKSRRNRPAVEAFVKLLSQEATVEALVGLGLQVEKRTCGESVP